MQRQNEQRHGGPALSLPHCAAHTVYTRDCADCSAALSGQEPEPPAPELELEHKAELVADLEPEPEPEEDKRAKPKRPRGRW